MGELAPGGSGVSITQNIFQLRHSRIMNRRAFLKTMAVSALCAGEVRVIAREFKSSAGKARSVRLDSDGMLIVNGRREFIVGLYSLPNTPNPLEETRDAGFNLVNLPANATDFAKAREHGLYGWTSLGSIS